MSKFSVALACWFAAFVAAPSALPSEAAEKTTTSETALELTSVSVAPHLDQRLRRKLRKLVVRELARVNPRPEAAFTLTASLVELSSRRVDDEVDTLCVVSASVLQAPGGALHATLRGSGRVHSDAADSDARELALEAAVAGALRQVNDAVRKK